MSVDAVLREDLTGYDALLHLGVYAGSENVSIECRGLNFLNLQRMADVSGSQKTGPVVADGAAELFSGLDCPRLVARLRDAELNITDADRATADRADQESKVVLSTFAGDYLCNCLLYWSLHCGEKGGAKSVFVHMPLFEDLGGAEQFEYLEALVEFVAEEVC